MSDGPERFALPDPELRARRVQKLGREAADEIVALEQQLAAMHEELAAARALAALHVAGGIETAAERDALRAQVTALADASRELEALRATKLMRWSSAPRGAYGRIRRSFGRGSR